MFLKSVLVMALAMLASVGAVSTRMKRQEPMEIPDIMEPVNTGGDVMEPYETGDVIGPSKTGDVAKPGLTGSEVDKELAELANNFVDNGGLDLLENQEREREEKDQQPRKNDNGGGTNYFLQPSMVDNSGPGRVIIAPVLMMVCLAARLLV